MKIYAELEAGAQLPIPILNILAKILGVEDLGGKMEGKGRVGIELEFRGSSKANGKALKGGE